MKGLANNFALKFMPHFQYTLFPHHLENNIVRTLSRTNVLEIIGSYIFLFDHTFSLNAQLSDAFPLITIF